MGGILMTGDPANMGERRGKNGWESMAFGKFQNYPGRWLLWLYLEGRVGGWPNFSSQITTDKHWTYHLSQLYLPYIYFFYKTLLCFIFTSKWKLICVLKFETTLWKAFSHCKIIYYCKNITPITIDRRSVLEIIFIFLLVYEN